MASRIFLCALVAPFLLVLVNGCDKECTVKFFQRVDTSNDGNIDMDEMDDFSDRINADGNSVISKDEANRFVNTQEPILKGCVEPVFQVLDTNKNTVIGYLEVGGHYFKADTDKNFKVSRSEYDTYVASRCSPSPQPGPPRLSCGRKS